MINSRISKHQGNDGANNKDCSGAGLPNNSNIVSIANGNLILDPDKINSKSAFWDFWDLKKDIKRHIKRVKERA